MKSFFKKIFRDIQLKFFNSSEIPKDFMGIHDCGLRALYLVLPDLSVEEMKLAFNRCCEWWPHKGVTNKEFNIALSHLKIKDRFSYHGNNSLRLKDLKKQKNDTFIALIYGHYTVIKKGVSLESYYNNEKIFCHWKLLK